MALIIQRTRTRVLRRGAIIASLPALPGLPIATGTAIPNRATRRLPRPGRNVTAAIAVPAFVLAALALHAAGPSDRAQTAANSYAAQTLEAALSAASSLSRGLPSLPTGVTANQTTPTPRLTAVLAADLAQSATSVFIAQNQAQPSPAPSVSATAAPAGPSLEDLLRAQARVATAQLVLEALQQRATADQIAAAQQAVNQAQADLQAAQNAEAGAKAAADAAAALAAQAQAGQSPAPPGVDPAQYAAAQQDVANAQAALQAALHPYTDDEINSARAELANAQLALVSARQPAALQAPPAPTKAPTAQPTPVPTAPPAPTVAPTAPAQPASVAAPSLGGTGGDAVLAAPGSTSADAPAVPAQFGGQSLPADSATPGAAAPVASPAVAAPAPTAPIATATPKPSATPAPAGGIEGETAMTAARLDGNQNIALLQQSVADAEARLAIVTAPPDPAQVQTAQAALDQAQQRLAALVQQGQSNTAAAQPPAPQDQPASATAGAAQSPDQQTDPVQQAQQKLQAAQAQLQALQAQPDPSTVAAAQQALTDAKQQLADLEAQAQPSVTSQVDPDPQSALAKVAQLNGAGQPDLQPFIWPAHGPITSFFGPSHPLGIDIGQGLGLPVRATASGVVTFSGGDPTTGYGYYVDITHPGGYMSRYGHLMAPSFLKVGDKVVQGQIIGVSGATGDATGPHLHFEIRFNGVPLDPLKLLAGSLPAPVSP